jgi:hypothetical protein
MEPVWAHCRVIPVLIPTAAHLAFPYDYEEKERSSKFVSLSDCFLLITPAVSAIISLLWSFMQLTE